MRALKRTMGKEIKIDFYRSLDKSDANAAFNQVSTGLMSGYVGAWGDQFFGGPEVIEFEKRSKQLLLHLGFLLQLITTRLKIL